MTRSPQHLVPELLVFSDDWARHPSSCQHLIRELSPRYKVYWVNTIGTRPPRLDLLTLRRGAEKLRSWAQRENTDPSRYANEVEVVEPMMWPSFRSTAGRSLNRFLLARSLRDLPPATAARIGITTVPIVADIVGDPSVDRWIYYCVDDLAEWPGLDKTSLERMERVLVDGVDQIIAVSDRLVERMASLGRSATLLTHGVDPEHWVAGENPELQALEGMQPPLVVFWGVVDRRLDFSMLSELSRRLTTGTVALFGPHNNPDPRIRELSNVVSPGPIPFEDLPEVARRSAVLVMPYDDTAATRAIQPLKLKEYLATGKPVVVSSLPAVIEWSDACDVVSSAKDFGTRVLERIEHGVTPQQEQARRRLEGETWRDKARTFETLIMSSEIDVSAKNTRH